MEGTVVITNDLLVYELNPLPDLLSDHTLAGTTAQERLQEHLGRWIQFVGSLWGWRDRSVFALRYAKQLNALMIGEEEASYLGVNVNRLKWIILSINVVIVAVATAFTGVISFVGLIVPHILRMLRGSDNRFLIVGSALLGATLLSLADLVARLSLRPAELPIGIVTSAVGVPVFLSLLRRRHYVF